MNEIRENVERHLIAVDASWRFLRMGDVDKAKAAAMEAGRFYDELMVYEGKNGVSFDWVGNLIVGVKGCEGKNEVTNG